ncbi:YaaR family protein [Neobacillus citreus]|uniref:YaaR family protein n=1 Tax=Neobacillus citreus TaxID=2833578 RepID=A0A942SUZ9_9BACI|nr:YaaR family protein [Neobacillus citreus]MCH6263919.1 YaaR family protein [Neobacillus citreus]
MKIQDTLRVIVNDPRVTVNERTSSTSASFQKIMSSYTKELNKDYLQQLLDDITQQGQQLSEKPTFAELRKYKDLIKRFMDDVTKNGIGLHQTDSWDPYGGNKTLKTIQIVDRKLVELTDHILNQQATSLSVLDRIGEIKGLLINLYT